MASLPRDNSKDRPASRESFAVPIDVASTVATFAPGRACTLVRICFYLLASDLLSQLKINDIFLLLKDQQFKNKF